MSTYLTTDQVPRVTMMLPLLVSIMVTIAGSDPGLPTIYPSYLRLNTQVKKVSADCLLPPLISNLQVICGTIVFTVYTQPGLEILL